MIYLSSHLIYSCNLFNFFNQFYLTYFILNIIYLFVLYFKLSVNVKQFHTKYLTKCAGMMITLIKSD